MPNDHAHTLPAETLSAFILLMVISSFCFAKSGWCENSEIAPHPSSDPWFTGTLLSTRGRTLDPGRLVVQPYFFYTRYGGLYNDNWRLHSATVSRTIIQQTFFIYGLTNRVDIGIAPQWLENSSSRDSLSGFGDLPVQLGFQVLKGDSDSWVPHVLFWVQEVFPTGRYNDLGPSTVDLGGIGGGSFGTTLGLALQKVLRLGGDHVLRYRLNASYGFYSPVTVRGFNTYGGGFDTTGRVEPGSVTTFTVAGEYTLTRHIVLALDIGFQTINATHFSGTAGIGAQGEPAMVGKGYSNLLSIAPAVEYHFTQHVGLIAGPWFSLRGKNTSEFFGVVAALYLFL
ncbi:MAG TPA: hypothetical protein DEA71_03885 [Nitrospira sp.]|nr:hypothetical protein [Nitrospira sp.]